MAFRPSVFVVATALLALGCISQSATPSGTTTNAKTVAKPIRFIQPSQLIPDLDRHVDVQGIDADGTRRYLWMRMRISEGPDGSIRKAPGLFPSGRSELTAIEMPSRLGEGYLFAGTTATWTQLWRANHWLAPLEPLVRLQGRYENIIPGFDRIYLSTRRANTLTAAVDPSTGEPHPLGPLPEPITQGPMVFADAWRAVAIADFRGPLATFNAGATWVPLGIPEVIDSLSLESNVIVMKSQGSRHIYALDTQGNLATHHPRSVTEVEARPISSPRPLRLAIERGYPIAADRALVAYEGNLLEISTKDGSIQRSVPDALPISQSECQGIALGSGAGFVCGAYRGETVLYAYEPPNTLKPVLSYPEPKAVFASGNGAIVVRAPCPNGKPIEDQIQYCVRDVSGSQREIRFQGDLGAERVVALSDGRVAILIAPRPGAEGRLVVLDGIKSENRAVSLDALSPQQRSLARRGLWLQGAYEVKPGVLGVWVEGGGPVVGLHIDLEGKVKSGALQSTPGVILTSGRFGLVWRHGGEGLETTDGGLTWKEFELPVGRPDRAKTSRGCSAVGCAVEGWLRVGWGKPADPDELAEAPESTPASLPYHSSKSMAFTCAPTGRASPPPVKTAQPYTPPRPSRHPPSHAHIRSFETRAWIPFGPLAPPSLGTDDVGASGGRDYGDLRFRAYAWGPKAADWSRSGRWMIAFDDPYDPVGMPVTSVSSLPPWHDPMVASIQINSIRSAVSDPGGRSAVFGWCPAPNLCQVFGVEEGKPPVELTFSDATMLPVFTSAVRSPEGWYLMSGQGTLFTTLHAADESGRVRIVGTYPRVGSQRYDRVQLVRRARGSGIGILAVTYGTEGDGRWLVLPIDPPTGALTSVQDLGATDLGGQAPPTCAPGQDGWLVEVQPPVAPRLRLPDGTGFGGSIRIRLRIEGDRACMEGLSARAREEEIRLGQHRLWMAGNRNRKIQLAVWDNGANRKYELMCSGSETTGQPE